MLTLFKLTIKLFKLTIKLFKLTIKLCFMPTIFIISMVKSLFSVNSSIGSVENELIKIDNMDGIEFEYYIAKLLSKVGYRGVKVSQASGDYGVDITAKRNRETYAIQCKNYSSNVGNSAVQEVVAGLKYYNCSRGVVMTNSYFTENAKTLAKVNNIELWDRDELIELIRNANSIRYKLNKSKDNYANTVCEHRIQDYTDEELLDYIIPIVLQEKEISTSFIQLKLNIGYFRAARLIDELEKKGIVSCCEKGKPRKVIK